MEKEFVPYELALRMKQIGFNENKFAYYYLHKDKPLLETQGSYDFGTHSNSVSAPLYQQAFRWFRNEHGLKSWVEEHTIDTFIYQIRPHVLSDYKEGEIYVYNTHEQTELACLEKLIEIVERNNIK
jgi:hypothetical protein